MKKVVFSLCVVLIHTAVSAQSLDELYKVIASDGEAFDDFGISVSISGNNIVIGGYNADDKEVTSGSAYIFYYDGINWIEQTKLQATDGIAYEWFGNSVSISGDYGIIGVFGDDDNRINSGAAHLYKIDTSLPFDYCARLNQMVNLGQDTIVCEIGPLLLDAWVDDAQYLWGNGQTTQQITVHEPGTYWVTVTQNGCSATDTVNVDFLQVDLGKDIVFCESIDHTLKVDDTTARLRWSTGDTTAQIHVTQPGTY